MQINEGHASAKSRDVFCNTFTNCLISFLPFLDLGDLEDIAVSLSFFMLIRPVSFLLSFCQVIPSANFDA